MLRQDGADACAARKPLDPDRNSPGAGTLGSALVTKEFGDAVIANMDRALERACRFLSDDLSGRASRKIVAERIVKCARTHTRTLAGMTEAARQAVAELSDDTSRHSAGDLSPND